MKRNTLLLLVAPLLLAAFIPTVNADEIQPTDKTDLVVKVDKEHYTQLLATKENLSHQKAAVTAKTSTKKTKAQLESLSVESANIESKIKTIDSINKKIQDEIKAKEVAEQKAKELAEQKAKEEAERKAEEARKDEEQRVKDLAEAEREAALRANANTSSTEQTERTAITTYEGVRGDLVAEANKLLGIPYVWGGTDPNIGLDCSGFTKLVYARVLGLDIGRTTWNQDATGEHIPLADMQPGDLIMEHGKEHIAIYIGNGQQIDAPQPGDVVSVRNVPYNYGAMYGLKYVD